MLQVGFASLARAVLQVVLTDGGGWWWMVDGRKKSSLISLKLCTLKVSPKFFFCISGIWSENFLMGLKIDFEFEKFGFFV